MASTVSQKETEASSAYDIDTEVYDKAVRLFRFAKRFLHIHIQLHDPDKFVEQAQIFVFNHFARFETLIPPYLIYECCGAYCCAIAHRELFEINDNLTEFLMATGAIPHDHPNLFPLLATQILRGRKVIIFPEGGMVKDRRVIDRKGHYSIFSRTTHERRKQHTGAAVLGLGLDIFKQAVIYAAQHQHQDKLERWQQTLGIDDLDTLLERCRRPTLIAPANITFFPLRIAPNLLEQLVTTLQPGISKRYLEELIIESNMLLKETDMDIRLAKPVEMAQCRSWWERRLIGRTLPDIQTLEEIYQWQTSSDRLRHFLAHREEVNARCIRNQYMEAMYQAVTVNLCHLAATLIYHCLANNLAFIGKKDLTTALYLAIKNVQQLDQLHLHRSIGNPACYQSLPEQEPRQLQQFLNTSESAALIEPREGNYHFLPKLCQEFAFDTIRLENPLAVYANEVAPLSCIKAHVSEAFKQATSLTPEALARLRFDDEVRSWRWDFDAYSAPCFAPINREESRKTPGEPFLLEAESDSGKSVLLIHGLLAMPPVMRPLGEHLVKAGYTVLGIRLKGHGTSPCDLRERTWQDWFDSVLRGYRILSATSESISLVGFSTGGLLALLLAADQPDLLTATVAITPALRFRTPIFQFVPLVHQANVMTRWMASEGVKEFMVNTSEHPDTNYSHIPIRALYELRQLINETEKRLPDVHSPALIMQGDQDPVVDPESARLAYEKLGSHNKTLTMIPSRRHDIVFPDTGKVHEAIRCFLDLYTTATDLPT